MHSKDKEHFFNYLMQFPEQIYKSKSIVDDTELDIDISKVDNIIYAGMGGSAFAGELFLNLNRHQLKVPLEVSRHYKLPAYVNEHTLFVAASYSGNTEETLSAAEAAQAKNAQILTITAGGELAQKFSQNSISIPAGLPPRQALGYLYFGLTYAFAKTGIIEVKEEEITDTVNTLRLIARHNDPDNHEHKHFANTFAQALHHRIPVIYADGQCCDALVTRWRNQLNENSKVLAYGNVFPELNHNEIVGYEMDQKLMKNFIFVFLRDLENEHDRLQKRIELTKKMLKEANAEFMEIFPEGRTRMARVFSLLYRGDWVSYYLALLNDKSPLAIKNIDFLKAELAKA
jgi:glucose/mannose-6-phosphate isomerase